MSRLATSPSARGLGEVLYPPIIAWLAMAALLGAGCGDKPDLNAERAMHGVDCFSCHGDRYQDPATVPDHVQAGFPKDCALCHSTEEWSPASFEDHDQFWPLTGRHEVTSCAACHVDGVYAGTPRECSGCHLPDYEATEDPPHVAAGYPKTCEVCHTTEAWSPAEFAGHDQYWPLEGRHVDTACAACHEGGVYAGTPRDCEGCHQPDYDATTEPDHVAGQFPTTCASCHTAAGWSPADFGDHDRYWPLRGNHRVTACASCHEGGVYEGTPTQCEGCHMPAYEATTNPTHAAPLLPTTCASCHTADGWVPAELPTHDQVFVVSHGDHRRYGCADCHQDSASWARFTCVGCHDDAHGLTRMNAKHDEVSQYSSTLAAYPTPDQGCLHCHPRGLEGGEGGD